ncbi:MAG TPA: radical SAM protein [Gemmatimonadaceae bacterium]|nr:radical SAM protein [Gemmatimonadaceae bacterium]
MRQAVLFPEILEREGLPILGEQRDIRYLGSEARSILNPPDRTGMPYWSINPYVGCAFGCAYCYARYAHRYVMERAVASGETDDTLRHELEAMPPWLAFERRIVVKHNAPALLRSTLFHGGERYRELLAGAGIVIGTATDPYQPAERRFRVTRGVLEVLGELAGLTVNLITKSPLVTRDIDLLSRIAARSSLAVHVSLITLDRALARRLEPRAPTPESRLRALARLREAGIEAGINCMPVLPGITDHPAALEALVRRASEAGATHVSMCTLRLQHEARQRYLPFIEQEFPHLATRYRNAYAHGHQVGERYREGLRTFFRKLCRRYGVATRSRVEEDMLSDEEREESAGSPLRGDGRGTSHVTSPETSHDSASGDVPGATSQLVLELGA